MSPTLSYEMSSSWPPVTFDQPPQADAYRDPDLELKKYLLRPKVVVSSGTVFDLRWSLTALETIRGPLMLGTDDVPDPP